MDIDINCTSQLSLLVQGTKPSIPS